MQMHMKMHMNSSCVSLFEHKRCIQRNRHRAIIHLSFFLKEFFFLPGSSFRTKRFTPAVHTSCYWICFEPATFLVCIDTWCVQCSYRGAHSHFFGRGEPLIFTIKSKKKTWPNLLPGCRHIQQYPNRMLFWRFLQLLLNHFYIPCSVTTVRFYPNRKK